MRVSTRRAQRAWTLMCTMMLARLTLLIHTAWANPVWFQSPYVRLAGWLVMGVCVYLGVTLTRARVRGQHLKHGFYKFVAHPAYLVFVLADIPLWFLAQLTILTVATGIIYYFAIILTAYLEEISLIDGFGESARNYYQRTPSIHFFLKYFC